MVPCSRELLPWLQGNRRLEQAIPGKWLILMENEVEIWPERAATQKLAALVSGNWPSRLSFAGAGSGVLLDSDVDLVAHEAGD